MNFQIAHHQNFVQITSKVDKLDVNSSSELKSELVLVNKNGNNNIILDLTDTKYCDSSGLSAILMANRLCKDTNGQFILVGLNQNVFKLIQIAQLDKVLTIKDNVNEVIM